MRREPLSSSACGAQVSIQSKRVEWARRSSAVGAPYAGQVPVRTPYGELVGRSARGEDLGHLDHTGALDPVEGPERTYGQRRLRRPSGRPGCGPRRRRGTPGSTAAGRRPRTATPRPDCGPGCRRRRPGRRSTPRPAVASCRQAPGDGPSALLLPPSGSAKCARRSESRARPRAQRLFTVPGAQPRMVAASSTEYPSMSTRTSAARWSAVSCASAETTSTLASWISNGSAPGLACPARPPGPGRLATVPPGSGSAAGAVGPGTR